MRIMDKSFAGYTKGLRSTRGSTALAAVLAAVGLVGGSMSAVCHAQRLPTPGSVAATGRAGTGSRTSANRAAVPANSIDDRQAAGEKLRGMSPFYVIGRIAPAMATNNKFGPKTIGASRKWCTGTMIGSRHILSATSGVEAVAQAAGGLDKLVFELPDIGVTAEIADFAPLQDSNLVVVLLKRGEGNRTTAALRKKFGNQIVLPVLSKDDDAVNIADNHREVRATGYDMPSAKYGIPGVSVSGVGMSGLIHRKGGLKWPDHAMMAGFVSGALKGHSLGSGSYQDGIFGSTKKTADQTHGVMSAVGVIGGGFIGAVGGVMSDLGFFQTVNFEWNDGATGGPVWIDENPPKIVGLMSLTRRPEWNTLGGIKGGITTTWLVEAITAPAAEAIADYVARNP